MPPVEEELKGPTCLCASVAGRCAVVAGKTPKAGTNKASARGT